MIFTVGNLLTLGIVLVVLAIFRQLDRSNRSLDKVRKYADKAREELDLVTQEKVQNLKDLSIEVDVHQKTTKEVLKKIQAVEESMQTRLSEVDAIGGRIKEYDLILNELVQMTKRAEENMARIREESEFTDTVAKRIRTLNERMDEGEKKIPALVERFEALNAEALTRVESEQTRGLEEKIAGYDRGLAAAENRVNEFFSQVADFKEETERLEAAVIEDLRRNQRELLAEAEDKRDELMRGVDQDLAQKREQTERYSAAFVAVESEYQGRLEEAAKRGEALETKALGRLKEHFEERLKALAKELGAKLDESRNGIDRVSDELMSAYKEKAGEVEDKIKSLGVSVQGVRAEFSQEVERLRSDNLSALEDFQKVMHEKADELESDLSRLKNEMESKLGETRAKLGSWTDQLGTREIAAQQRLQDLAALTEQAVKEQTASLRSLAADSEARLAALKAEGEASVRKTMDGLAGLASENRRAVEDQLASIGQEIGRIEALNGEAGVRITELGAQISGRFEELNGRLRSSIDEAGERIAKTGEAMHSRTMEGLEARLSDYEKDLAYRFAKIEATAGDLDKLETNLKEAMEKISRRIREEFLEFGRRLQESRQVEREAMEGDMAGMRDSMHQLENGLNDLKARAYENVSEKLKVFEDEFFLDLKTRDQAMQERFSAWQSAVKQGLDEARQASDHQFREELAKHQGVTADALNRFEQTAGERIKSIQDGVEKGRKELFQVLEGMRSEVNIWQARIVQDLKASEAEVNNQFAGFKVQVTDTIGALRDDFGRQKDELVNASAEERVRLKREIAELADAVRALEADLQRKTAEALKDFSAEYQAFQLDQQKRSRDLAGEFEQRMRDFRTILQDHREQFDALHQKLFSKLDDSSKILSVNLVEMEKKQKNFLEQTRLFERADTLKAGLQQDIESLKADLARVEAQRKDVKELETTILKLRRLGEEVSEKMTRFMAEKRRIDLIEEDFNKLSGLTQQVEQKLSQTTTTNDSLQSMLANLRTLEGVQQELESRYDRLEKKKNVIDSTIDGVDKNFQTVSELEKKLDVFKDELSGAVNVLDSVEKKVKELSSRKELADRVVKQIGQIDRILSDLEGRIDNLQKAREWLAGTETRLEEVNRQAQEQVKLLGSLLKEEGRPAGRKDGAKPSMSARETVTRLAHQGWTVEQIAKATKLSRGEVELILELSTNK